MGLKRAIEKLRPDADKFWGSDGFCLAWIRAVDIAETMEKYLTDDQGNYITDEHGNYIKINVTP